MSSRPYLLALSCSTLLVACTGLDDEAANPLPDDQAEPALTDTIVTVHADGSIEQETRSTTAEQRQAELALAVASRSTEGGAKRTAVSPGTSVLPVNPNCAGADLWLYDSAQAHLLCLSGAHIGAGSSDSIDLRTVNYANLCLAIDIRGRCTERAKWAGRVQFIWPGANAGRLYLNPQANPTLFFSIRGPFQSVDPAQTFVVVLQGTHLG